MNWAESLDVFIEFSIFSSVSALFFLSDIAARRHHKWLIVYAMTIFLERQRKAYVRNKKNG